MGRSFYAYMLKCSDGSYYVGSTDDLEKRIGQHQTGEGCKYTLTRRPVKLVWSEEFPAREEAKAMEARLKGWRRAKKEALIEGRFDKISEMAKRRKNCSR